MPKISLNEFMGAQDADALVSQISIPPEEIEPHPSSNWVVPKVENPSLVNEGLGQMGIAVADQLRPAYNAYMQGSERIGNAMGEGYTAAQNAYRGVTGAIGNAIGTVAMNPVVRFAGRQIANRVMQPVRAISSAYRFGRDVVAPYVAEPLRQAGEVVQEWIPPVARTLAPVAKTAADLTYQNNPVYLYGRQAYQQGVRGVQGIQAASNYDMSPEEQAQYGTALPLQRKLVFNPQVGRIVEK